MMLFVTHPKYFDKRAIIGKKIDLGFVFDSKRLYDSFDFKCVNIGKDGKIRNENFFPQEILNLPKGIALSLKQKLYGYLKKREHKIKCKYMRMVKGYKDAQYKLVLSTSKHFAKKDLNQALIFMEREMLNLLVSMIEYEMKAKDSQMYAKNFTTLYNITNSFFRAYTYSLGYKRGTEVIVDVLRFGFLLNVIEYYLFDKYDIYEDRFDYKYLKVLSRLFIEYVHRNDIKGYIEKQLEFYEENFS